MPVADTGSGFGEQVGSVWAMGRCCPHCPLKDWFCLLREQHLSFQKHKQDEAQICPFFCYRSIDFCIAIEGHEFAEWAGRGHGAWPPGSAVVGSVMHDVNFYSLSSM